MRRLPWDLLLALLIGCGLGLVYSWIISPLRVIDAAPAALRGDFKDDYRASIAAAYAASGNLPRAEARISLLKDSDPIGALNAQAQRMLATGASLQQADQVAALALALDDEAGVASTTVHATEIVNNIQPTLTITIPPPTEEAVSSTETLAPAETQPVEIAPTPRPTRTTVPTLSAPFTLTGQETVCDPNLPDGLLQVIVLSSNRRQMPGIKIEITWDGGEEQFFTGLKPELGNGYADYIMSPNISYSIQLALGSDIAAGLIPPTCQTSSGDTFPGGIKLTFQQP